MRTDDPKAPFAMRTAEGRTRTWLLAALTSIQRGGEADDCPSFEALQRTMADIARFFNSIKADGERDGGRAFRARV